MNDMSPLLQIAIDAAKVGAKKAQEYFQTNIHVEKKSDNTIVTIADRETEKVIKEFISQQVPGANIAGEESGGDFSKESLWIIDPIDGSRSFTRGIPTWAVLIAYYEQAVAKIGVCYFPMLNTILYAERGKGAFLDGKPTHVSTIDNLKEAYTAYGSLRHFTNKQIAIDLTEASASIRSPEPTYAAYLVATGRMDAHIDVYGHIWDFAPFIPILEEAGGRITNIEGKPLKSTDRGSIVTNGLLHEQVLAIVNKNNV